MTNNQRPTSVFQKTHVQKIASHEQASYATWMLIVFLIITFFILKKFIYIKDGKRHGK